jgi:hypothetical protein
MCSQSIGQRKHVAKPNIGGVRKYIFSKNQVALAVIPATQVIEIQKIVV